MRFLIPLLLILAGCGGTSVVRTSQGAAYQVDCGGPFSTKLDCEIEAEHMCPAGFNPISSPPGKLVFSCANRPMPPTAPPPS